VALNRLFLLFNKMKHKIDLDSWLRKEHFEFFNQFDEPYHGVTVNIDCTVAYQTVKKHSASFFLYYLYKALSVSQTIDAFKLRIEENEVYSYDRIDAGSAIGRPDGTFGFGDFTYYPTFDTFHAEAVKVMRKVEQESGLTRSGALNVIRFSPLPWINFTSLSHARMFTFKDSCPKISFGKMTENNRKRSMPISIHVHHALIDGYHLGQFIERYQELMNTPL
jgi:chloramphenicol O-acetyltransferase type A